MNSLERADLALAVAIADAGSLAGAARTLSTEPPAISKRLSRLEAQLGFQLFHRSTRQLQVSVDGDVFIRHAREVLAAFESLSNQMLDRHTDLRGPIRLCCSLGFGRHVLAPLLAEFQTQHPLIHLQLQLVDRLPDLVADGFDAAVWLWSPTQANLRIQTLAQNRRVLVAAPSYLQRAGTPRSPQDLTEYQCLTVNENNQQLTRWSLQFLGKRRAVHPVSVRVSGPLISNSGEVVCDWARAGHGIMLRSLWDVHAALKRGELVQVLPDWGDRDANVHWVLPPRSAETPLPLRLRRLHEHLTRSLRAAPWNAA